MILRRSGTGLLRTCKQVNVEATDILYKINTFAFIVNIYPIRANAYLELLKERKSRQRLLFYSSMNDILQIKDFFKLIGVSNRAKIRHIKIEIDVHLVFLGYVPLPSHYTSYCALLQITTRATQVTTIFQYFGNEDALDWMNATVPLADGVTGSAICEVK